MTINEIKAALQAAKEAYLAKAPEAEREWRPLSDKVRELQKQLHAAYAEGAHACKNCGQAPIGMERSIQVGRSTIIQVYEIGCSTKCSGPPLNYVATDPDREKCVAQWNKNFGRAPETVN